MVHHAFRPGSASVAMDDALDVRQTNARALEFLPAMQALKHSVQFAGVTRVETRPIIADEDYRLAAATGSATYFDFRLRASAGELHRIGDQIYQHHAQQRPVSPHRWQRVDVPGDL